MIAPAKAARGAVVPKQPMNKANRASAMCASPVGKKNKASGRGRTISGYPLALKLDSAKCFSPVLLSKRRLVR